MMQRLPQNYSPILFGLILSEIITLVVSGVSSYLALGLSPPFLFKWGAAWLLSWLVAFPVILFIAPLVRKLVAGLVKPSKSRVKMLGLLW